MKGPQHRADRFFFFPLPQALLLLLNRISWGSRPTLSQQGLKSDSPTQPSKGSLGSRSGSRVLCRDSPATVPAFPGGRRGCCWWLQRLSPTEH